mgnify:FL=1
MHRLEVRELVPYPILVGEGVLKEVPPLAGPAALLFDRRVEGFAQEVAGAPLTLVDFFAPWCGPCRLVSPILEELARDHAGRLKVVKVNVDEHPGLAARYGVRSVPTLVLFRRGAPVATWVGASPRRVLEERLRPYLEGR